MSDKKAPSPGIVKRRFFRAAQKGDVDTLRETIALGVDVNDVNGNKWTALEEASRHHHPEAVAFLIEQGADPNARHPSIGFTPLFVATFSPGSASTVDALLRGGAAPSLTTKHGWTALHNAAENGDHDAARRLLEAGANGAILGGSRRASALDRAKDPDAFAALLEELEDVPKQSEEEAERVAEETYRPPPKRFTEMAPLPLDRLDVVGTTSPVAAAELDALRRDHGAELPEGYAELLGELGSGLLHKKVRVYGPEAVRRDRSEWLARLAEYWLWDEQHVSQDAAQSAMRLADTLDGHELIVLPRKPNTLWLLPHEDDDVLLISRRGFRCALSKLVANRSGRLPRKIRYETM